MSGGPKRVPQVIRVSHRGSKTTRVPKGFRNLVEGLGFCIGDLNPKGPAIGCRRFVIIWASTRGNV